MATKKELENQIETLTAEVEALREYEALYHEMENQAAASEARAEALYHEMDIQVAASEARAEAAEDKMKEFSLNPKNLAEKRLIEKFTELFEKREYAKLETLLDSYD